MHQNERSRFGAFQTLLLGLCTLSIALKNIAVNDNIATDHFPQNAPIWIKRWGYFSAGFTVDHYAHATTTAQKAKTMSGGLLGAV